MPIRLDAMHLGYLNGTAEHICLFRQFAKRNDATTPHRVVPQRKGHTKVGRSSRSRPKKVAAKLKLIRTRLGLTQPQMIEKLNVKNEPLYATTISAFERGPKRTATDRAVEIRESLRLHC